MSAFCTRRTTGYRIPSGPVPSPTAPPIPPVEPGRLIRTAAKPPRVLVLSESQGLFLGLLKCREGRSVTLSPCRRLRPAGDPDIPYTLYGGGLADRLSDAYNVPEITLLDVTVIVPAPE